MFCNVRIFHRELIGVESFCFDTLPFVSRARCSAQPCIAEPGPTAATALTMPCFVYILASGRSGTLYVGVTNDPARRMAEHTSGAVPGFTRAYGIDKLVYIEEYATIIEARAREYSLKRWRRAWKIKLIESINPNWDDLSETL